MLYESLFAAEQRGWYFCSTSHLQEDAARVVLCSRTTRLVLFFTQRVTELVLLRYDALLFAAEQQGWYFFFTSHDS